MTWSIQEGRGILELYRAVEGHSPIRQTNTENILERSKKHRPKQVTSIVFSAFWVGSSDHHPAQTPRYKLGPAVVEVPPWHHLPPTDL